MTAMTAPVEETPSPTPQNQRRQGMSSLAPRTQGIIGETAARTSAFVRLMKVGLPILAVVIAAMVMVWPQWQRREEGFRVTFTTVPETSEALTMEKPRYQGLDQNNRPYMVTADRAIQDPTDNRLISLDRPQGDMISASGNWVSLLAKTGLYNQESRLLMLHGDINLFSDEGNEFHGLTAEIDFGTGTIISDDKVWGHGPFGSIKANAMRISDKGARIEFTRGVNTRIIMQRGRKK